MFTTNASSLICKIMNLLKKHLPALLGKNMMVAFLLFALTAAPTSVLASGSKSSLIASPESGNKGAKKGQEKEVKKKQDAF